MGRPFGKCEMRRKLDITRSLLVLVSGVFLFGCASSTANSTMDLTGTSWVAMEVAGTAVNTEQRPTLTFDQSDKINGSGGCNNYFGTASIANKALSIGPVGSTQMACEPAVMDQEMNFFAALERVRAFALEDELLLLLDDAGVTVLRLASAEAS